MLRPNPAALIQEHNLILNCLFHYPKVCPKAENQHLFRSIKRIISGLPWSDPREVSSFQKKFALTTKSCLT